MIGISSRPVPRLSPSCPLSKGRIMRIAFFCTSFAAWLALSSFSQAAETFTPKFPESTKQRKEAESKTEQTLTIAGMGLETKVTTFSVSEAETGKRDAEGKLSLVETVKVLQADLNLPGGLKLQFDSANPDKEAENPLLNPILEVFRTIVKYPITTVIDRDNKIASSAMAENAFEKLPKETRSMLEPARLKKEQEDAWKFLPDKPVNVGDDWERYIDKDLGGGQIMNFKLKYAYAGPETKDGKTYHKFTTTSQEVTYTMDPTANPMVQCSKSDLKINKSSGTILYDPATGEIPLRESSVNITGTLTLVINGQEFPSELDLTMSEKTKLQK